MRRLVIYKLELICVKYVPIIIALLSLLDNILKMMIVRVIQNCGIISRKTNYKGQVILPFIFFFTYPKYK